jgi:hypothetical protein
LDVSTIPVVKTGSTLQSEVSPEKINLIIDQPVYLEKIKSKGEIIFHYTMQYEHTELLEAEKIMVNRAKEDFYRHHKFWHPNMYKALIEKTRSFYGN